MLTALLLIGVVDVEHESYVPTRYEAFVFMATACPMAKLYAERVGDLADRYPQIHFQGISVNQLDSDQAIADFARNLRFGFRRDPEQILRLAATRSPEAVLLVNGNVVYRGRIDDQYAPGTNRSKPTRCELEEAIKEVLAHKPVSVPRTVATGCRISLTTVANGEVTFDDVAPVIHQRCAECHRPGQVAPFSLLTYEEALSWKEMIGEVVQSGRMPPWHADPQYGTFANDRSLSAREKSLLIEWCRGGAPRGQREHKPPTFQEGWTIRADLVLQPAKSFRVPREGVLDYQEFALNHDFELDTWIQAIEIRPGNAKVVHHIHAFLRPKGRQGRYVNEMGDSYLGAMVPGRSVTVWPDGIAKLIPAGFEIVLLIHYQPNGTLQEDRSTVGLQFADPSTVRQKAATRIFLKEDLMIPPNEVITESQEWVLEDDYTLLAIYPHMHLRGRSMRFEVVHPQKVILSVPRFDFNWQHRYVLAEPIALPANTVIRCTATFDNTSRNANNPDPSATVRHGKQSTDEMFQACFEVVRTRENRLATKPSALPPLLAAIAVTLLFYFCRGRSGRPVPSTET